MHRHNYITYLFFLTYFFVCQFIIGQSTLSFSEIRPPYASISPTISKMEKLSSSDLKDSLNSFWERCEQEGTPLIEKDPVFNDYVYVTFIYRNTNNYTDIRFFVPGIYEEYRFGDKKMHQLKNSELFYRTFLMPDDICFAYRFDVKNSSGKTSKELDPYNTNRMPKGDAEDYSYSVLDRSSFGKDWGNREHTETGSILDSFIYQSQILNNKRDIYVYLPPGYNQNNAEPYPVLYLFDAFTYVNRIEAPVILDNLIVSKKIPPVIAVMFDNPTSSSRYAEYPLNFQFKDAIVSEFIPLIREKYHVSHNPENTLIGGMSYGGLAAAFFAFYHPDIFGNVLSQSGSFWRDLKLDDNYGNEIRNDWLPKQFDTEQKKNLKIYLDWGLQENMVLGANRNFAKILHQKNYMYKYVEYNGWHNWANTRRTFPLGLMFLLSN